MSLFKPSSETGKSIFDKILIYGPTHSSKTHAALSWPDPALIDVENRGAHFADRFNFFHAQPRTMAEILEIFDELKAGKLPCQSLLFDSYSAMYEKLIASHTQTFNKGGKIIATTDYAMVNKRVAPAREFIFSSARQHVIIIAHQQQKYDRNGEQFSARKEPDFFGDTKFRYAFDFILRTEPTGNDPRVHAIRFVIEKSASPRLKIGDALVVKPGESLYQIFRRKVSTGETPVPSTAPTAAPASKAPEGPIVAEQLDEINALASSMRLGQLELGNMVKSVTRGRTPMPQHLMAAEAQRLIVILEQRIKNNNKGAA